jgi:hypothetical protein
MSSLFKAAGRLLDQKKEDYLIKLKFCEIFVEVGKGTLKDCSLVVEWKRGPES